MTSGQNIAKKTTGKSPAVTSAKVPAKTATKTPNKITGTGVGKGMSKGGGVPKSNGLPTHHLQIPVSDAAIAKLRPGDIVYFDGIIYTAREGVYKKVIADNTPLPLLNLPQTSNVNFHCSPAASLNPKTKEYTIGGVTATASFRFSGWMARWLDLTGTRIILGKGGMPASDYTQILAPRKAVYITTVGYGTGALLGRGVTGVDQVFWLDELGIAQAMWLFRVRRFGPFIVDSDIAGNSLFADHTARAAENINRLYEGLNPPALSRYGETDNRKDEVM